MQNIIHWIKYSYISNILIICCLIIGIFIGVAFGKTLAQYYEAAKTPQHISISNLKLIQPKILDSNLLLEVTLNIPKDSFNRTCDRLVEHMLISDDKPTTFIPLNTAIAGANYKDSSITPKVILSIPGWVPRGHYHYVARTLYLCNIFPAGLISYHLETNPYNIDLKYGPYSK